MNVVLAVKAVGEALDSLLNAIEDMKTIGTRGIFTPSDQLMIPIAEIHGIDSIEGIRKVIKSINASSFEIKTDQIDHHGAEYWVEIDKNEYLTSLSRYLYERLRNSGFELTKRNRNATLHIVVSRKTVVPRKTPMPTVTPGRMTAEYIHVYSVNEEEGIPVFKEIAKIEITKGR